MNCSSVMPFSLGQAFTTSGRISAASSGHVLIVFIFGFLSVAVLNVNNMRDIENDRASGQRTLVVRLGLKKALHYHALLTWIPFFLLCSFAIDAFESPWRWLALLGFVPIGIHAYRIQREEGQIPLDPELKRVALGTFSTALLYSLGLILA